MLVTDRLRNARPLPELVSEALAGGATQVQLRERGLTDRALFDLAVALREETRRKQALLIINHRLDVALAAEADGVHLGWRSLPVAETRRLGKDRLTVGVSVHSLEEARSAERDGADYVTFGPIYATPSKAGLLEPVGTHALAEACAAVGIPVLAIGGITAGNVAETARAGAAGAAVISAIMGANDPAAAARELLSAAAAADPAR